MLHLDEAAWFALAALALVLTPGPNMVYCVSRTLAQGRATGRLSLAGMLPGFVDHLLAAAPGLTPAPPATLFRMWLRAQRWLMGGVPGGLAVRIALEDRK